MILSNVYIVAGVVLDSYQLQKKEIDLVIHTNGDVENVRDPSTSSVLNPGVVSYHPPSSMPG